MRPSVPDGDLGAIVEQAVTEKLQRLEARRFARTPAPRKTLLQSETSPTTRQIPAAVKRAVYERDAGRCRYQDEPMPEPNAVAIAVTTVGRETVRSHRRVFPSHDRGRPVASSKDLSFSRASSRRATGDPPARRRIPRDPSNRRPF
jgi:hypothetical protein